MTEIILASTSPYRRKLLERLQIPFSQMAPPIDEENFKILQLKPRALAERLAFEKANSIHQQNPLSIVIGSDQLVSFGEMILGKPHTKEKAVDQLLLLQGKTHQLIT